jgi:hypothetical protein
VLHVSITKFCADYLREQHRASRHGKLQASHAHELVAAYFGYKSNAALRAEADYPLAALGEAKVLVPNVPLIEQRRKCLDGLPHDLPSSMEIATMISSALQAGGHFHGEIWLHSSLSEYIMEDFLHRYDGQVHDDLSGVMAETNAYFDEAYYESAEVSDHKDSVVIEVKGTYSGESDPDRMYCGDKLDVQVTLTLYRCAGRTAFSEWDISARGEVSDYDVEPELLSGNAR